MKGDFTRQTFDPVNHYSRVLMQQGRVQLDADWNEQAALAAYHAEATIRDLAGAVAFPDADAGFAITPQEAGGLQIGAGHAYVAGILCENDAAVDVAAQPDLPGVALPTADGAYLAYLDVWQRHLTAVEQPALREVALGGPDTTTRLQTVWQVKLEPAAAGQTAQDFAPGWAPAAAASTGRLRAQAAPTAQVSGDCLVPPGAGYRRLENQLYRVEIHDGSANSAPTFKWSRDNGSVLAALDALDPDRKGITVADPGRDAAQGFGGGQWVELSGAERTLRGEAGLLLNIVSVQGNTLTSRDWPTTPPRILSDFGSHPTARRWDGTAPLTTDGWIELEDGVQIAFDPGTYQPGDYWLIPARALTGSVEWPQVGSAPLAAPRHGISHAYAALALLTLSDGTWTVQPYGDCRVRFPALTDLVQLSYVGGDGQTAAPGYSVAQPLQVGVSAGSRVRAGQLVRFRVIGGGGSLTADGQTGTEIVIRSDAEGVAACAWRLDNTTPDQQVEARLADGSGLPIRFNADLNDGETGLTRGFHITDVRLPSRSHALTNDSEVSVNALTNGIQVVFDRPVAPEAINQATCFVTVEIPTMAGFGVSHYQTMILDTRANVTSDGLQLAPTLFSANWLDEQARHPIFFTYPRFLAHLILKGHAIWAQDNPDVYLDGDLFGVPVAGVAPHTDVRLPSGDNRRGGTLDLWFWLIHRSTLDAIQITPTDLRGGVDSATLQVVLAGVEERPTSVALTSSNPAVLPLPPDVIVPAGQAGVSLEIIPLPVEQPQTVTVSAMVDDVVMTAVVTVQPYQFALTALRVDPQVLYGWADITLSVSVSAPSRTPLAVALQSSDPQAFPVPSTIQVPAGQYNADIRVRTGQVYNYTRIEITATLAATTLHATLELHPPIG